jgi:hypothetical protein
MIASGDHIIFLSETLFIFFVLTNSMFKCTILYSAMSVYEKTIVMLLNIRRKI